MDTVTGYFIVVASIVFVEFISAYMRLSRQLLYGSGRDLSYPVTLLHSNVIFCIHSSIHCFYGYLECIFHPQCNVFIESDRSSLP